VVAVSGYLYIKQQKMQENRHVIRETLRSPTSLVLLIGMYQGEHPFV